MTEIFYQLFCHANGQFYLFKRPERFALVKVLLDKFIVKCQNDTAQLSLFLEAKDILNKVELTDATSAEYHTSVVTKKQLADQCLVLKNKINTIIENQLTGIVYSEISNETYSSLIHSQLTDYFYLSLSMGECRARFLEYLLGRSSLD